MHTLWIIWSLPIQQNAHDIGSRKCIHQKPYILVFFWNWNCQYQTWTSKFHIHYKFCSPHHQILTHLIIKIFFLNLYFFFNCFPNFLLCFPLFCILLQRQVLSCIYVCLAPNSVCWCGNVDILRKVVCDRRLF